MKKIVNVITLLAIVVMLFSCKDEASTIMLDEYVNEQSSIKSVNAPKEEINFADLDLEIGSVDSIISHVPKEEINFADLDLEIGSVDSIISHVALNDLILTRRMIRDIETKKQFSLEIEERIYQIEDFFEAVKIRNELFYGKLQVYSFVANVYEEDKVIFEIINEKLYQISSNMSKESLLEVLTADNEPADMTSDNQVDKLALNQLSKRMVKGDKVDTIMQLLKLRLYQERLAYKKSGLILSIDSTKWDDVIYAKAIDMINVLAFNQMLELRSKIKKLPQNESDFISSLDNWMTRETQYYLSNNFLDSIRTADLEKLYEYKKMIQKWNDNFFGRDVEIIISYKISKCKVEDMPIILKHYETETEKIQAVIKEYFRKIILENESTLRETLEEIKRSEVPKDLKSYIALLVAIKFT
jgi:hypothetical protein